MQKLVLIILVSLVSHLSDAQNVGIGTQSPHASAVLDVSSTNKGMLAPRMNTSQRTAIASPAKGLLVYDTDVNSLFHYNGSAWANLSSGGGGGPFALPYTASVDLNTNVFSITNAGYGAAISGTTSNDFGYAVSGFASGTYGYAIYGYAEKPNAIAVYGLADLATAVQGKSTGGYGLEAISTSNSAIKASVLLGNNTNPVILSTHPGAGNAIDATSTTGTGVLGRTSSTKLTEAGIYGINNSATTGYGVLGVANSASAVGIQGNSTNGTGIFGSSSGNGTALRGQSTSGYGLMTSGKIRLDGGNTNPATGAVLTSTDGIGNAVWKPRQIAFKAYGTYSSFIGVPMSSGSRKMHFASEQYDYGNNFTTTTSGSPSASMSTFEVPTGGLYHFDVGIKLTLDDTYDDFRAVNVYVILERNNVDYTILTVSTQCCNANLGYEVSLYGSIDQKLEPGDSVRVQIYQWNDDDATAKLTNNLETYFGGHLVFAN
jgi:hypothetical protein